MRSIGGVLRWVVAMAMLAGCGQPVAAARVQDAGAVGRALGGLAPAEAESPGVRPAPQPVAEPGPQFRDAGLDDCLIAAAVAAQLLGTVSLAADQPAGMGECSYRVVDSGVVPDGPAAAPVLRIDVRNAVPATAAKSVIESQFERLPGIGDAAGFLQIEQHVRILVALGDRSIQLEATGRPEPERLAALAAAALDGLTPYH